jgi:acyl-CoA hydrolase
MFRPRNANNIIDESLENGIGASYSNVFRSHKTASARSVLAGPSAIKAHTTITKRLLNIVSTNAVG